MKVSALNKMVGHCVLIIFLPFLCFLISLNINAEKHIDYDPLSLLLDPNGTGALFIILHVMFVWITIIGSSTSILLFSFSFLLFCLWGGNVYWLLLFIWIIFHSLFSPYVQWNFMDYVSDLIPNLFVATTCKILLNAGKM